MMMMTLDALKERMLELCNDEKTTNTNILFECLRHIAQLEKHLETCQRAYFYKSMLNDEMVRKMHQIRELTND